MFRYVGITFALALSSLLGYVSPAASQLGSLLALQNVQLATAGPSYWTVLALGSLTNVSITGPSSVRGIFSVANVGVPTQGNFSMSDGAVDGTAFLNTAGTANISGPSVIVGGVVKNAATDTRLAQAVTDAHAAAVAAASLPCGQTLPALNNKTGTIFGTAGVNVVCASAITINGGAGSTVTLNAPSGASFVVKVSGDFALTGGAKILLAGGVTPLNVLYYVAGTGSQIALSGGTSNGAPNTELHGILLAPGRNIAISPGLIEGEVIGGGQQITITSGGRAQNPTASIIAVE